uniref:(S)-2-hydroxy-acid oxidase n=1 Tax=Megaselia scalaris TaxID=36166 RepID=T1GK85_MEGSC
MAKLVCVAHYEEKCKGIISKPALDYYRVGSGEEETLKRNKEAFKKLRIRPRVLRNVENIDMSVNIFGHKLEWPVGISPSAMQKMAHPEGEVASARAAGKAGSLFILSSASTTSLEEVAEKAPDTYKWFHLYIFKDRNITENLVRRAEKAGYKALVLTVDQPVFGLRRIETFELPAHLNLANFANITKDGKDLSDTSSGLAQYTADMFDATMTWKDIEWFTKFTKLPVILKGILTKEDAILALNHGCKGIIVSNHGGRQFDGVPSSIEVLPEIVDAVGKEMLVTFDSGVYLGVDAFKALALGAKMVFLGRAVLWGLGVDGQKGVEDVLSIIRNELSVSMALAGSSKIDEIRKDMVVHENYFSKL